MNVIRAVAVFSLEVTSAFEFLNEQAGHGSHPSFAFAGPAIVFMKNIFRWFTLHDTSNEVQHIYQPFPDTRHFDNFDDDRLEWLDVTFPLYIEELKKNSTSPRGFLTTETYEALLLTTYSTCACVRHLLVTEKFYFVLTRKFSSDPTRHFLAHYKDHLVVMTNWLCHVWVREATENGDCCIVIKQQCSAQ